MRHPRRARTNGPARLLLVVRAADQIGGLETVVRDAAVELESPEFRVTLAVVGDRAAPPIFDGLDVVRADGPTGLRAEVRASDVLHLHAPTLLAWPTSLLWTARRHRIPTLVTLHLPAEPRGRHALSRALIWVRRALGAVTLRAAGADVYAPSSAAASVARYRLFRLVRVRGLRQGVRDRGVRPPAGRSALTVAFVGRMVEHKQPHLLIEALADARARGVPISADLVGDGPLLRSLKDRARALGLPPQEVRFHGYLDDPTEVLASSDLLVLPSLSEGCPVVVMEAAALGRASVVRQGLEGVDEVLPDAHLTVGPHAGARELATRLIELAADRELVVTTGRRARAAFESDFSLAAAGRRYARAYREAMRAVAP
ncbi:glycosyltransferase family 4 protein [Nocardioides sp. L-11A]|uniref:glycosyltransferase family 4 protein n=1 Tax=Nocardioides sp. L-11A TaxID=3043848 RepID=UPI00249B835E|nr:glycosyltransferase [Nocardioides sp. L-11A]